VPILDRRQRPIAQRPLHAALNRLMVNPNSLPHRTERSPTSALAEGVSALPGAIGLYPYRHEIADVGLGRYGVAADIEQVASSKQLPTDQRGTDNAEQHQPN
jgi:hypothetical protein